MEVRPLNLYVFCWIKDRRCLGDISKVVSPERRFMASFNWLGVVAVRLQLDTDSSDSVSQTYGGAKVTGALALGWC